MTPEQFLADIAEGGRHVERGVKGLFDLYGARMKAYFHRHRLSDEDASDLLQETFIKLVRSAAGFRHESRVQTWIWSIARNCLNDFWRTRCDHESVEQIQEDDGDAGIARLGTVNPEHEAMALRHCVRRAFEEFSRDFPENATAIQLAAFEGWTMEELGSFLGRTANATKEFVSQCKKRLRPYLEHCRELLAA